MDEDPVQAFIETLAAHSEAFGFAAGVGAMETAGAVISFLAERPDWTGAFIKGGVTALPMSFMERGRLTWLAANGEVVSPEFARRARIIAVLKKPKTDAAA